KPSPMVGASKPSRPGNYPMVGSPQLAKASTQPSNPTATSHFRNSIVLETHDDDVDSNGEFRRVEVLQTKMKYPFIRVETVFRLDPTSQAFKQVRQVEMVADHVVVQLQPGQTEAQLQEAIAAVDGTVRKKLNLESSATYLVALPRPSLDAVPNAIKTLSNK